MLNKGDDGVEPWMTRAADFGGPKVGEATGENHGASRGNEGVVCEGSMRECVKGGKTEQVDEDRQS